MNKSDIRKLFTYQDGTLIWKDRDDKRWNTRYSGKVAGSVKKNKYVDIRLHNKCFQAHRLIWIYHNGMIKNKEFIDHIDQDPSNNSIKNLRLATKSENGYNRGLQLNNNSGFTGVSKTKYDTFISYITIKGKRVHLGSFTTAKQAARVRDLVAIEHHGEFACLNFSNPCASGSYQGNYQYL